MKSLKFFIFLLTGIFVLSACSSEKIKEEAKGTNEPTQEEWEASYQTIAISETERYVELTETNGDLPVERLTEHSGVVQQQADKLTDEEKKKQFTQLATLIKENKLEEVKALINDLK